MRVAIIEDEKPAAENLKYLLSEADASIRVDAVLDSVSSAVDYFSNEHDIELAFFDIHLADGISFEIFEKVEVDVPVIFTTAYDEYALKAFKVNSIDYLLKPVDEDEFNEALEKFKTSKQRFQFPGNFKDMIETLKSGARQYKSTFLVQQRDVLIPVEVADIAYFMIDLGTVKAVTVSNETYVIDEKLEDIEAKLNPDEFFRANRQYIVQRKAIANMTIYFNGKLLLNVAPKPAEQIVVSKVKAPQLKKWLN